MSTTSHDVAAEASLLGSVMQWPDKAGSALLMLEPGDFYLPPNEALSGVLSDMLRGQQPIDPTTVMSELADRGMVRQGYLDHSTVFTMYSQAWNPMGVRLYAESIRKHRRLRALGQAQMRMGQYLDERSDPEGVLESARADLAQIPPPLDESLLSPPPTLRELLEERKLMEDYDWLVTGMLERRERLVITGTEGAGKSEVLAQFACSIAAGIHPLTGMPEPHGKKLRVLILDFENSRDQARRRFARIAAIVSRYPGVHEDWTDRVFFEAWGRSDIVRDDRTRFEQLVASASPDVIVTGPAYQMGLNDPNSEPEVVQFTGVLDRARLRANAALLLEAHPGHATGSDGKRLLRPSGSSVWLRWPEIGIGIRRNEKDSERLRPDHVDIVSWRAPREGRMWPLRLRNAQQANQLPWEPDDTRYMIESSMTGDEEF